MPSRSTKKPCTLLHKPPGPLPPPTLPSPPSVPPSAPPLPSPPYNVPPLPPPTADEVGGDGCGGPRSASPVTPLSFPGNGGDNDDAGSSAALPSLPGNRPEHNNAVATSGQGWHSVDDDVGPSAAPPSVPGNRSKHDDALATSGQGTHTVDGDAGPSAAPPSVPRNRSENNDAGPSGAAPLPWGMQFKDMKRRRKESMEEQRATMNSLMEEQANLKRETEAYRRRLEIQKTSNSVLQQMQEKAAAAAPAHHINLDLELRLRQPSPPALVRHPTLAGVRPPGETTAAWQSGWELQMQMQSADSKVASRLARKRRMEILKEKKMHKRARRSD
ncbi:hypothetical protein MUK42_09407 [Musa troglodytarum]|uniref:Uncharacterized protein n=1 Tax=Musa troglodytarum TaxID=320322 RepID=A0A9E7EH95_9LILI|nr:hypothetical protein MUK42_09407 [Musa troglodytarum]